MFIVPGYAGYVHPCGAVSVGAVPRHKKSAEERRAEAAHKRIQHRINNRSDGTALEDCLARQLQEGSITVTEAVEALSSLGSSSLQNSRKGELSSNHQAETEPEASGREKPIRIYGQKGITSLGRLRVRDGATILERKFGRRSLTFATVTLPAMPEKDLKLICESWGKYVNRFVEEVKRELVRKNAPTEIIYCTEIQEKRYERYGQVAPHLHLLWYAYERDPETLEPTGNYAITADRLREINYMILRRIVDDVDICVQASVDVQKVKKSAANYLGKYMSKGGKIVEKIIKDGKQNMLPKAWWGVTQELRQLIIKSIIKIGKNLAANLFRHADKLEKMGVLSRWGQVTVKRTYHDKTIGKEITADIVYGIYAQLSPKLMHQNELLMGILDICDKIPDADIDYIATYISAMNDAEMVQDVCNAISALKEILLADIETNELVDMVTGEIIMLNSAAVV